MFLIAETEYCCLSLRRFSYSSSQNQCPKGKGYGHDASVVIDPKVTEPSNRVSRREEFAGDSRWPTKCSSCDYIFQETDQWQVNRDRLWKGSPDGKLYTMRESPPGATWVADWFPDHGPNGDWSGPDGKVWCVMLPAGVEWIIYGYASGPEPRKKWNVEGTPPNITVSPSIHQVGYYHGFINGGVVSKDGDGKKFPHWPSTA